jgi:hypothetical protein
MDRMWASETALSCTAYGGGNTTLPVTMCPDVPDAAYSIYYETIEMSCSD